MDDQDQALTAWEDLGPTRRLPSSERRSQPNARIAEIIGKLGLRFPPANSVDREAHAARVALLAEDCDDINPDWLEAAASEWAKRERFFPKACEMRELAIAIGRTTRRDRLLAPPPAPEPPVRPVQPPLTEDEIAKLPSWLVKLGVSVGDLDPHVLDTIDPV